MATSLFDQDGIQVRFLNSNVEGNNINSEQAALNLLSQIRYSGLTPLGTSLDKKSEWSGSDPSVCQLDRLIVCEKVLQPLILGPARANQLQKPVLVITITDGTPAGEPKDQVFRVIQNANAELQRTRYGPDALSLQFARSSRHFFPWPKEQRSSFLCLGGGRGRERFESAGVLG